MTRLKFIVPLLLLLLTAACASIYGVGRDERSVGTIASDEEIVAEIKAKLVAKDSSAGLDVKTYCYGGHVFLVGAPPASFRSFASQTAHAVGGVKAVTPVWFREGAASGTEIAAKVRSSLIANASLSSTQIDQEVYDGEVVLLGMVRSDQDRQLAQKIAGQTAGVKGVRNYLMIGK